MGGATIFSNPSSSTLLTASNIGCERGNELLFSGFSFAISAGTICWLKGPNGRGKTSLLRMIAGLSPTHAGSLTWHVPHDSEDGAGRPALVYVGHDNALKGELTALESLGFLARLTGVKADKAELVSALGMLRIRHRADAKIRTLSQGQRRRVALARLALQSQPSLWLLDEPFDALDEQGSNTVNVLMERHVARGGAVLLTSHTPVTVAGAGVAVLELPQ